MGKIVVLNSNDRLMILRDSTLFESSSPATKKYLSAFFIDEENAIIDDGL